MATDPLPPHMITERVFRLGATLGTGLAVFLWLGHEDIGPKWPVALGLAAALITIWHYIARHWWVAGSQATAPTALRRATHLGGLGSLAGLETAAIAFLLMAIKTSLHEHPAPDFSLRDLLAVASGIPIWMVAGLLSGWGIGLIWWGYNLFTYPLELAAIPDGEQHALPHDENLATIDTVKTQTRQLPEETP